jgi:hypothetical protein
LLVHSRPPPQSEAWQQVPATQIPEQHFWPVPHCPSTVQLSQAWLTQILPLQSALLQQAPATQLPPQHLLPGPH